MAMRVQNEFVIDADVDQTWMLLTDLGRTVPCMPGAVLEGMQGDDHLVSATIRVGPVTASFRGTARFTLRDDAGRRAVIVITGSDEAGQAAGATVRARLEAVNPTGTRVLMDTDLSISGRTAQYGRGAFADASSRLIAGFVTGIAAMVNAPSPGAAATVVPSAQLRPAAADGAPTSGDNYRQALLGALIGFVLSWLAFGRQPRRASARR